MASIISSHNRRVTGSVEQHVEGGCNWRSGRASCVLQRRCLTPNVVYKCTVSAQQECKEYIGLTSNTFKQRYYAHSNSFNKEANAYSTALSLSTKGTKLSLNAGTEQVFAETLVVYFITLSPSYSQINCLQNVSGV